MIRKAGATIVCIVLVLMGCSKYQQIEEAALSDIVNDYLAKNRAIRRISMYNDSTYSYYPVYISQHFLPLYYVRSTDAWLFLDTLSTPENDSLFRSLTTSERIDALDYRTWNNRVFLADSLYAQIENPIPFNHQGIGYIDFQFSRICFDKTFSFGLVWLEYMNRIGDSGQGELKLLLIENTASGWRIREKT